MSLLADRGAYVAAARPAAIEQSLPVRIELAAEDALLPYGRNRLPDGLQGREQMVLRLAMPVRIPQPAFSDLLMPTDHACPLRLVVVTHQEGFEPAISVVRAATGEAVDEPAGRLRLRNLGTFPGPKTGGTVDQPLQGAIGDAPRPVKQAVEDDCEDTLRC